VLFLVAKQEGDMATHRYFKTAQGRELAYHHSEGTGPAIVFLSGFKSDMQGTKAVHLEAWARRSGRAFLRFDYSGHGQSSGAFTDGCISDWSEDAVAAVTHLIDGPVILVGSSMGGWIALLLAQRLEQTKVAGMVTVAAAPDFTEDSMWVGFDDAERSDLQRFGQVVLPSDYDEPYVITRRLIEDGRQNLVLRAPLALPFAVRFLQGTADKAVEMSVALRLLEHAMGPDMHLTLVDGADHRFSDDVCLALIERAVAEVALLAAS
tara:strand:+ start:2425 stop:3216 length:792 start_codon:yes stop_codon:yes gene_type:complete